MAENSRLPPGPIGFGLPRLIPRFRDAMGFFLSLRKKYGDIVYFRLLSLKFCVIFDADMIDQVLAKQHASFEKGPAFKAVFDNPTTGTADGESHKRMRKLVQPAFLKKALEGYGEIMIEEALALRNDWCEGETIDLEASMQAHSQNVIAKTFFGRDVSFDSKIIKEILGVYERIVALSNIPFGKLLLRLPLPVNRHYNPSFKILDEAINSLVRKAHSEKHNRNDLVSLLARATDEDNIEQPLSDEEVRDEAYAQIMAGHETVANTMTWCFFHISRNPAVRARLEREVDEVLKGRLPLPTDYMRLVYARAVFDETLRLSPPLYILGRRAIKDCVIGGYRIPRGTIVQPMIRAPHLEDKYYPQADEFKPERWLETRPQERSRRTYIPFGSGPRACIGLNYGRMEGILTLAIICQQWRVDIISKDFPELSTLMVYRLKHGLPVKLHKRK